MKKINILFWEKINLKSDFATGTIKEDLVQKYHEDGEEAIPKIATTPFGVFQLDDYFNPMKQYNWEMCHTNFSIGKQTLQKIKSISGVEKVLVVSKYRFLVAFGKAFSEAYIKALFFQTFDAISLEANNKLEDLNSTYEKWALYFLREDKYECVSEGDEHFEEKMTEFKERLKTLGGMLITNED